MLGNIGTVSPIFIKGAYCTPPPPPSPLPSLIFIKGGLLQPPLPPLSLASTDGKKDHT